MNAHEMEVYTARCQFWLSIIFLSGYFTVLLLFMLGYARIPADYKEAFSGLLTLLTGGGLTILYFWFQRTRSFGTPPGPGAEPTGNTRTVTGESGAG